MFKFKIGRKFDRLDFGRSGFLRSGEMSASLNFDGKVTWVKERFARCESLPAFAPTLHPNSVNFCAG